MLCVLTSMSMRVALEVASMLALWLNRSMRWLPVVALIPFMVSCGSAPLRAQKTMSSPAQESALVREMNAYRRSNGKPALREESQMNALARGHSQFLSQHAADNGIHRSSIAHANASERFAGATRMGFRMVGENVYSTTRFDSEASVAKRIAEGWWHSSGHRANMLRDCHSVGVGIVRGASGATFATAIFANKSTGETHLSAF